MIRRHWVIVFILITRRKVPISYPAFSNEIMKSHACYNYSSLLTSLKFWHIQQHPEFYFQNSKRPIYDISNPGMCVIKRLFYTCWWRAVLSMLHMVPCTPIRRQITRTIWVPRINYIILPYIFKCLM